MPVYSYKCKDCDASFEVRHSMSFEGQQCIECGSHDIFKIPSLSLHGSPISISAKPGRVVNEFIQDAKKEIKKEKLKLKSEEM